MKTLLMFSLIFFSACFTILFSQTDYQNPGTGSSSFLVKGNNINFEFHQITNRRNGYTLQSNSSPQQLWLDLNNPEFLHAVFTNSQWKDPPWPDRTCIYFGSIDAGYSWFELGTVPDSSRAGFPAIYGTSDGRAVIVNHNNFFDQTTRSSLFIDSDPFHYNFTAYDPGTQTNTLWPRGLVTDEGNVFLVALTDPGDSLAFNFFDSSLGSFTGWLVGGVTRPEAYTFSMSDGGTIGFTYIGGEGVNDGDVFYRETTDGGITWSPSIKIFNCPAEQGIAVGALRGINLNFYGEEPCVVFEVCQQDFNSGGYFPRLPNEILFWSPSVNGGVPKVIADGNNVPFAPSLNPEDVFPPLCRPVMGHSETQDLIYVAFSAATENVYVGADSITYFAGYITFSSDGGQNWYWEPEKFTPEFPLLDWKYISGLSIYPVYQTFPIVFTIHFVLQADSLEAKTNPLLLSTQYYHASFTNNPPSVNDIRKLNAYNLEQNYPNPFNPNTTINYQIPELSFVTLKVYDVLGSEITTLVNEEKPVGSYEVEFDATILSSGVYFYRLQAGSFVETKKMVLMK
jgi:hypothetical protein